MKTKLVIAASLFFLLTSEACVNESSVDKEQAQQTETLLAEANRQVGMPNIVNFTERKLMKQILELRDTDGLHTYTYIIDLNGHLHFLTESIGFGLPYSVQYTNPERKIGNYQYGLATIPQADPNGLFMPTGLSATWVIAVTENGPTPMYVEPQIVVSTTKLDTVD